MPSELIPKNLVGAAQALDSDPVELVRVMTRLGRMQGHLTLSDDALASIRAEGSFEPAWLADATLPDDSDPGRQHARAALLWLAAREDESSSGTRVENLWRGMDPDAVEAVRVVIDHVAAEGLVTVTRSSVGTFVAVKDGSAARIRDLAEGSELVDRWSDLVAEED